MLDLGITIMHLLTLAPSNKPSHIVCVAGGWGGLCGLALLAAGFVMRRILAADADADSAGAVQVGRCTTASAMLLGGTTQGHGCSNCF